MVTTDTTEIDLIPQRHKYIMQALVWYALHLFHPQKCGNPKSVMKQEVRP